MIESSVALLPTALVKSRPYRRSGRDEGWQKRKSERKFFPGYVLVEMEMNDDTWHIVKECPKVLGFIGGTPEKPAPITQREADAILARVRNTGEAPRPKTMFEPVKNYS